MDCKTSAEVDLMTALHYFTEHNFTSNMSFAFEYNFACIYVCVWKDAGGFKSPCNRMGVSGTNNSPTGSVLGVSLLLPWGQFHVLMA